MTAVLAGSSLATGSVLSVGLTWLSQNKIQRLSCLSEFINSNGYWILCRHITADFQAWQIVKPEQLN